MTNQSLESVDLVEKFDIQTPEELIQQISRPGTAKSRSEVWTKNDQNQSEYRPAVENPAERVYSEFKVKIQPKTYKCLVKSP